jgi:hypothetical protein
VPGAQHYVGLLLARFKKPPLLFLGCIWHRPKAVSSFKRELKPSLFITDDMLDQLREMNCLKPS